jgi:hypothetical protein
MGPTIHPFFALRASANITITRAILVMLGSYIVGLEPVV